MGIVWHQQLLAADAPAVWMVAGAVAEADENKAILQGLAIEIDTVDSGDSALKQRGIGATL